MVTLELFFEVNMPAPTSYIDWLASHLADRMPIEHLNAQAQKRLRCLEGATKVDAMLLAPSTGVAVLSDISTHITFDIARNQLARNIDVMLEEPKDRAYPLSQRRPTHTALVLVTPKILRDGADGEDRSRLYGWLMPAYRNRHDDLLARHLRHRDPAELVDVCARRARSHGRRSNKSPPRLTEEFRSNADSIFGFNGTEQLARTNAGWVTTVTQVEFAVFCSTWRAPTR